MSTRVVPAVCFAFVAWASAALAAPGGVVMSSGERPQAGTAPPPATMALFGLCANAQNADAFPSSPVPVVETACNYEQQYTATSPGSSTGGSCGGFTVVFGPLGDLKTTPRTHTLRAEWGDAAITSPSVCTSSRIAATAHGWRCSNESCTTGAWERIDAPRRVSGTWSTNSQQCSLILQFGIVDRRYNTLNLDIITDQLQGANMVRKRAKGTITSRRGNGKCLSGTATQQ